MYLVRRVKLYWSLSLLVWYVQISVSRGLCSTQHNDVIFSTAKYRTNLFIIALPVGKRGNTLHPQMFQLVLLPRSKHPHFQRVMQTGDWSSNHKHVCSIVCWKETEDVLRTRKCTLCGAFPPEIRCLSVTQDNETSKIRVSISLTSNYLGVAFADYSDDNLLGETRTSAW